MTNATASNSEEQAAGVRKSARLLKTKLLVPPPPQGICARPSLVKTIERALRANRRLVLLNAAAGFGKTTLLAEWAHESEMKVAWFSLDEGDNEILRFATYFLAALRSCFPEVELVDEDLQQPLDAAGLTTAFTSLINSIAEADEDVVVVLDDYHLIQSAEIHEALAFLLENLPQNMHLVVATRGSPPLPLVQMRARVQMTEIGEDQLKFSLEDAETYLNHVRSLQLSEQELGALCERTEGWIAGLQMAALSLRDRTDKSDFIHKLSGTNRYILDYLLEEVLEQQPPVLQDFMLRTSILNELSTPICLALYDEDELQDLQAWVESVGHSSDTEQQVVQEALEYLDRANLFVVPLDDERRWFRYHRLYADLLTDRLKYLYPERISLLHKRAGRWYESHELVSEAVGHIIASGEYERAAELLENNAIEMVFRGNLSNLTRWLDMLPEEFRKPLPWLSITHAWTSIFVGEMNPVAKLVREAEASLELLDEASEIKRISAIVEVLRGYMAAMRGSMSLAVEFAREAMLLLPQEDLSLRGFTAMFLAGVLRWTGELEAASEAYREALEINRRADEKNLLVETLCELAALVRDQGRLHQSEDLCREALSYSRQDDRETMLPAHACAWTQIGLLHCEWNRLQAAREDAQRALVLCREWGQAEYMLRAHIAYARVLLALDEINAAGEEIERAVLIAQSLSPWYVRRAEAWRARWQLARGEARAALAWVEGVVPDPMQSLAYQDLPLYILACRIKFEAAMLGSNAQRKPDPLADLLDFLERLNALSEAKGARRFQIEALLLQSLVLDASGARGRAVLILEDALRLAEPAGFTRTFIEWGGRISPLLEAAAERDEAVDYISKLLELMPQHVSRESTRPSASPRDTASLTDRELQVLRLLAAHLTSRDIAEELTIATSTVRSHMKNIYRKLDVHSRREAVERGQEMGLLH